MPEKTDWIGSTPKTCQICESAPLDTVFIDGKTAMGPWAFMCEKCHDICGCGLGKGKGQKYEKQENGQWLKVEG